MFVQNWIDLRLSFSFLLFFEKMNRGFNFECTNLVFILWNIINLNLIGVCYSFFQLGFVSLRCHFFIKVDQVHIISVGILLQRVVQEFFGIDTMHFHRESLK